VEVGEDGDLRSYTLQPEDVGLARARFEDVAGGTPADNADTARRVLAGEPGPRRDLAALNAGAAIYVAGAADTLEEGVRGAEAALDDGRAARALDALVSLSQELAEVPA
jgi:anthranilate phosphoribosyltransferase